MTVLIPFRADRQTRFFIMTVRIITLRLSRKMAVKKDTSIFKQTCHFLYVLYFDKKRFLEIFCLDHRIHVS
ncbi:hypothetical protein CLOSS21_02298 [Clostridium sp. SS2/1]|nr:hypothetical protein CLOSS21_02298 [Clostridium sp. SS2/1]